MQKRPINGLGARVVAIRSELQISQQVLATRAEISIPRLRDAESFDLATTATVRALARALNTHPDHLLGYRCADGSADK